MMIDRILNKALDEDVYAMSNHAQAVRSITDDLYRLSYHANKVFREIGGAGFNSDSRLYLDIHEPYSLSSPLNVRGAFTIAANMVPTLPAGDQCNVFYKLREPGLRMRFFDSGKLECVASSDFVDEQRKIKAIRGDIFNVHNLNRFQDFLGLWLRNNLHMKTILSLQEKWNGHRDNEIVRFHDEPQWAMARKAMAERQIKL